MCCEDISNERKIGVIVNGINELECRVESNYILIGKLLRFRIFIYEFLILIINFSYRIDFKVIKGTLFFMYLFF